MSAILPLSGEKLTSGRLQRCRRRGPMHPSFGLQQALWVQAVDVPHEGRMDRIADQLTAAPGQLLCDPGRHGEAHVLKLSHPADAVLRRDDQPRMVRAVGPATV